MRVNRGQEFVIAGFTPSDKNFELWSLAITMAQGLSRCSGHSKLVGFQHCAENGAYLVVAGR
jgi:hypothetical protein